MQLIDEYLKQDKRKLSANYLGKEFLHQALIYTLFLAKSAVSRKIICVNCRICLFYRNI